MKRSLVSGISVILLSACASSAPPPKPVTSFKAASTCTDAPSLATATALTPENPAGKFDAVVDLGAAAPCLRQPSGAQTPYAIFALPVQGKVASISAGAVLEQERVLAASVSTLGADGRVIRTFPAEAFNRRGRTMAVLFAPRLEEKFLVIAVEPTLIGKAFSLVVSDPARSGDAGADGAGYRPYSYAGQAFARAYFSDPGTQ